MKFTRADIRENMRNMANKDVIEVDFWGQVMDYVPVKEFEILEDLISFDGFHYDHRYREEEVSILQPRLESLGYHVVKWMPGETDCFGPLTRICKTTLGAGDYVWFVYG